ncbi:hypothetical protein BDA96_08G097600 [Sorghum bicolor]|uniref:Uncharacterized protein n=1 Tax=Sorghum bicolor TaxID=4558 RepID=A0A921QED2_SORBI|nr:hypothetical protein BDA96_08G097600 [Sorghum bicolor]
MRFLYFLIKQAVFIKHLIKFCRKSKVAAMTQPHHKLYSQGTPRTANHYSNSFVYTEK